jgi:hypothetical protein
MNREHKIRIYHYKNMELYITNCNTTKNGFYVKKSENTNFIKMEAGT